VSSRSLLVAAAVAYAITLGLWVVIASADVEVDPDGFIIEPIARMPFTAFAMTSGFTFIIATVLFIVGAVLWLRRRSNH
jgi:hypothetical protein